jgi:cyanophycinase
VTGPLALVGSGEYLPAMAELEGRLLAGRPPRYVQLATAAAPEGPTSLAYWHGLGRDAARRLGVEQVVVDVTDRASADDPALAALVTDVGLAYLSGGNPGYLAETLRGTAVWTALAAAWRGGAALAGCSAGAMALADAVVSLRHPFAGGVAGVGLLHDVLVLPHFDRMLGRLASAGMQLLDQPPPGTTVVGIDELTALVWDPAEGRWSVTGRGSVWTFRGGTRLQHREGETVALAPPGGP